MSTSRGSPIPTRLRLHLGIQEQAAPKLMPRTHTDTVLDVLYMDGREFHRASNGTNPTSNFHLSQRESSKQVDVQNLSGCCATIFWPVGPCIVLESIRGASRGYGCT